MNLLHLLRSYIFCLIGCFLFSCYATAQNVPVRSKLNFNADWRVFVGDPADAAQSDFDDSAWKRVTTPYAWNEDAAFRVSIHDLPTGVAWYRKHFRLPAAATGQKIFIEFEGIRQAGEVYLNGQLIGRHEDGVMAFGFDLSKLIKLAPEENVLAVRTDNGWDYQEKATGTRYHWNNANFYANYGGISKSVWLHITGPVYQTLPLYSGLGTTGVYIWANDFNLPGESARITVEAQVRNDSVNSRSLTYRVCLKDIEGRAVIYFDAPMITLAAGETRTVSASSLIHGLHFWSWGYGYLYTVTTQLVAGDKVMDEVNTRTGFRKTAFANGMIYLNDRVIDVHGYAQRTTNEWPAVGLSVPAWMSDLSNSLMVESNGNLVRWMHVTPWKQDVESCDRVGLLQSMPAGDAEGDSKGRQWEQRVELMRDAIIYNRNNPSILFYESGNKGISEEHMVDMKKVRDTYDPHGGRAIGSREMMSSKIAEYGGEMLYIDKSATKPLWAHEYSRDEGARFFWDNYTAPFHKDAPDYNRNQDSHALEDVRRWFDYWQARPGTGTRVSSGGVNIIFSDSNTHYRGDNNYRRSGEVDAMRLPKDGFYAHQVMWDGWVDVEHTGLHILGHWNYAAGTVKPVYVVSPAPRVELKLNGHSLGTGTLSYGFLHTFDKVAYEPGTLEAVGYDLAGKPIAIAALRTAGEPAALRLTAHTAPDGLHADGADLALVDVEVVDAKGNRCPTDHHFVSFMLTGPAEWRGGIAQGSSVPVPANTASNDNKGLSTTPPTPLLHEDNYILAKKLPVENGVNRVILRSQQTAGAITLHAEADGLKSALITLNSLPVVVEGGLSHYDPAAALPVHLDRGPTPATPSFRSSRTAIKIVSATAGSNAEQVQLSMDDDDSTSWVSKGKPEEAWIEYAFATPQTANQIDLKMGSFRQRHYPLRITVDGQTVWEGETPTTLGYCNLKLKPVLGQHLRISLVGALREDNEFGKIKELVSANDPSKPQKQSLSISESEIYKTIE